MSTKPHAIRIDDIFRVASIAAATAAKEIKAMRDGNEYTVEMKGKRDLVTTADLKAEQIILKCICEQFPDHHILSEETAPEVPARDLFEGPLWIIDPVDGTSNYAHQHKHVGVSIAFAVDGEVKVGVVECPFLKETFYAIKGQGAFLNGKPISVTDTEVLEEALIGTGFPYERDNLDTIINRVGLVLKNCRDLRRNGAASIDLCWVACGRLDAFYETLSPWDFAAGLLIAREAGAAVDHLGGTPDSQLYPPDLYGDELAVANPALLAKFKLLLTHP